MNFNRLVDKAIELLELPKGRCKHFTFIMRKKRIVSLGWNLGFCTHPKAKVIGYKFNNVHSELHALINFDYPKDFFKRCIIVNVRLNIFGQIRMSRPCELCQTMLRSLEPKIGRAHV